MIFSPVRCSKYLKESEWLINICWTVEPSNVTKKSENSENRNELLQSCETIPTDGRMDVWVSRLAVILGQDPGTCILIMFPGGGHVAGRGTTL